MFSHTTLQGVSLAVFFSPDIASQATPASTYGRTVLLRNRYLATSGNSQLPEDPMVMMVPLANGS